MSQTRRQFIEENRDSLQSYFAKMDDKTCPVYGFGICSPREAFKAILEDSDDFYLPVCLLYVFWDFPDEENRAFVLQSLDSLYYVGDNNIIEDTFLAYVYSYCLCQMDEGDKSFDVLQILANQCFPPALASMGDGCIAHQDIAGALDWYTHAFEHDYITVISRFKKLAYKSAPFTKTIPNRLKATLASVVISMKMLPKGVKGEHALYLDFYGIRHHLKKYWETPKSKRYQDLKTAAKARRQARDS